MITEAFAARVRAHLAVLYPTADLDRLAMAAIEAIGITEAPVRDTPTPTGTALITYADSIVDGVRPPLPVLADVLATELAEAFDIVHILPFAPSSSDRGFSVIDFTAVDPAFGSWADIEAISTRHALMADLVCNHVSSESAWFRQFLADEEPGRDYFVTVDPGADTSAVVRPRALPVVHPFDTAAGRRHVWCTFSRDQVDLNHANPEVMLELLRVIDRYLAHGARMIRLDAVAYLWKELGTPSIHRPETHEMIRLWHTLLERRAPGTALVTETNVPNDENVSYFGTGDEAHLIYNFTLPPLVVDAVLRGRGDRLAAWLQSTPGPPDGCAYFNFLASHDGIGLRPAEGILTAGDIEELVRVTHERGGDHGTYDSPSGPRPYELNISLWDLLATDMAGSNAHLQVERFLCAHAVMLSVAGVAAVYVNSLFAQGNDRATAARSGVRRDISRGRIERSLVAELATGEPEAEIERVRKARATQQLLRLLETRRRQPVLRTGRRSRGDDRGAVLVIETTAPGGSALTAVHNLGPEPATTTLAAVGRGSPGRDLISGSEYQADEGGGFSLDLGPYQSLWLTAGDR